MLLQCFRQSRIKIVICGKKVLQRKYSSHPTNNNQGRKTTNSSPNRNINSRTPIGIPWKKIGLLRISSSAKTWSFPRNSSLLRNRSPSRNKSTPMNQSCVSSRSRSQNKENDNNKGRDDLIKQIVITKGR